MKLTRVVDIAHRWLGLLLGIQVLLWMASGVVMSWFHIDLVRGERSALTTTPVELLVTGYANPGGIIAQSDGATSLSLKDFLGKPVYVVESATGPVLFDARTAERLSPLSRETALEVAKRDFVGKGDIDKIEYLTRAPGEFRRSLPVWRVTFNNDLQTRIYVSPATGEILARRNTIWRVYDFFWMLHIMDYDERSNFNNPLIKVASVTGLLFTVTGLWLVVALLLKGRYRVGAPRRKKADAATTVPLAD